MLEINWAPIVGAFVITKKSWDDMSPETQKVLRAASDTAGSVIRTQARKEVEEAVEAMKKRGLQVNKPNAEQLKEWRTLSESLYPRIRGKMVPAETFDEVFAHLKTYRATKNP
jgi:TRAP-type C4-dicarboxylate transport system substrate-binding protein